MRNLFIKADLLMFKDKQYQEAQKIYLKIIAKEKAKTVDSEKNVRNLIDAYTSIAYCVKFQTLMKDLLDDTEVEYIQITEFIDTFMEKPKKNEYPMGIFTFLKSLYLEAIRYDPNDVEANFNLAGLFLMRNDLDMALKFYL